MITILTKVYPEESLRYRFCYALRHGKFLGRKHIDRIMSRFKEQAFFGDSSIHIKFPAGDTEITELKLCKIFPMVIPASEKDYLEDNRIKPGSLVFYNDSSVWPIYDTDAWSYIAYPFKQEEKTRYFIFLQKDMAWTDVTDYYKEGKKVWIPNMVKDQKAKRIYDIIYEMSRWHSKITGFIYRFLHTIDSTYLCIRFPFLYPRNRFTGRHYTNWKLHELEKKLYEDGCASINYKAYHDESKIHKVYPDRDGMPMIQFRDVKYGIKKKYNLEIYYTDINGQEVILYTPSSGMSPLVRFVYGVDDKLGEIYKDAVFSPKFGWLFIDDYKPYPGLKAWSHDHPDSEEPYTSYYIYLMVSPEKLMLRDIIAWFHTNVLGLLFCIPTSNEIDAMDAGWFRRFGMDMLKEMKAQLKKDGMLHTYRIAQIKEKFGLLTWYDGGASKELHAIIDKYSSMSEKICIDCGRDADYITSGYILPLCEHCISEEGKQGAKKIKKQQN